ncbi:MULTISPECIES: TetR/AcrR family transcriptional regulator C-terminal domain-containing protein [Streptomyces]|uniref:TetR/AcrR family transcriptional regulator C-terminal domain-containing protein n=1 Tax=Streptomyces TaxID=1883 RepID=UPI0029A169B1|nr:TetR/AcrR family transcriptional regulator C-terminal domain-containing protein [Streptomyces sp. ND04-05B]MDX3060987.1 TetR/AcrR family transcriptional regulator C-terminal domain-containing protein [Streptomyces sp. ND04-05B]WRY80190.1 TetR/AcrR family transcriptional regulator C-terminal domain-containing protein [Streptomyces clavifer]
MPRERSPTAGATTGRSGRCSGLLACPLPARGAAVGEVDEPERWKELELAEYPRLTRATADLRDHDDRDHFTAGLDLLLDGLSATANPQPPT